MNLDNPISDEGTSSKVAGKRKRTSDKLIGLPGHLLLYKMRETITGSQFFAAASSSLTTKIVSTHRNEDRYEINRLPRERNGVSDSLASFSNCLYAAVFDGHGGASTAEFVRKHLKEDFYKAYINSITDSQIPDLLLNSFLNVDRKLYEDVLLSIEENQRKKDTHCFCKFDLENPCRCLSARREAREGTTGTVLVMKNNKIYVANVGDSEACLFSYNEVVKENLKLSNSCAEKIKSLNKTSGSVSSERNTLASCVRRFEMARSANSDKRSIIALTKSDTPTTDSDCEDYKRISQIAAERAQHMEEASAIHIGDGIRRGEQPRLNYVRLVGAHSLNMTRAFGNFGHKVYEKENGVFNLRLDKSPVISVPHLQVADLSEYNHNCFLVIASDGLWDNLDKDDIYDIVMTGMRQRILRCWVQINMEEKFKASSFEQKAEVVLSCVSSDVSHELAKIAGMKKEKLDDISVVVVLFSTILSNLV